MFKYIPSQLRSQALFAQAVKFARSINDDPDKRMAYPVKKGQSVFTAALADYIKNSKKHVNPAKPARKRKA